MRAAIFIDGGYFEKVIKNEFGEVPIDFAKLVEVLSGGRELLRSYYYPESGVKTTSMVSNLLLESNDFR